jgi:hypothetical protein
VTLPRIAFWFGVLELGFVLGVAFAFPLLIVAIAGPACLALMAPYIRQRITRPAPPQTLRTAPSRSFPARPAGTRRFTV